ncbi:MAG TPA: HAMP domain-containing sensor histidine kinase, partial [Patescibacteria group bacterium]|nr:HAMP domain-containing sensor histidine kinase [Patescibacteria group bacterium]
YMSKAISNWADGDKQIEAIISTAQQIKLTNTNFNQDSSQIIHKQKIDSLLKKVYEADDKATKLENDFSNTLGQGSRTFTTILITVTAILTTLLGILSIFIASLIAKATIKIDRTKSEFVSLASHQLRTPLTAINWYTESLLNLKNIKYSVKQKKLLSELFDATKRSSKLISDLLNVTELDLGTYKFEPQLINIREIIKNVDNDLKQIIKQKKIDLKIYIDRNLPKIKLDERVLTIIIQNLISNSVKYTPKNGSIKVRVTPKKDSILISVSDNGIGIPKDQQSQVFKKLFRADNAKKLDPNNSGLGLYISSSMASKIGGKIWFKSTEEIGSTFYVKLPIEG